MRQPPENSASEDGPALGLEPVAAERFESMLELAVAASERFDRALAAARRLLAERGRDLLHFALEAPDVFESAEDFREHRAHAPVATHLLRQVTGARAARARHPSAIGLLDAREDPAERRLAGAVRAHEADPLASTDPPRDVAEERLPAVPLGDFLELDHAPTVSL